MIENTKPSPRSDDVLFEFDLKIPTQDGTKLSANLYRPSGHSKTPVIFAITPYIAQRNHKRASYFAKNGYSFLVVDSRGRGNSEGAFEPFVNEANDGFDICEWIASQDFCDGQIAMFSGSYEGYVQWMTAKMLPPNLRTIAPGMSVAPGVDFPMRNNIFIPYVLQWLTFVSGKALQDRIFEDSEFWLLAWNKWTKSGRPFKELDVVNGIPSPVFQKWVEHPKLDPFWDSLRPTAEDYSNIDIPILSITGSYDADQHGALHFHAQHMLNASLESRKRHFLVIGPWDHGGCLAPQQQMAGADFGPNSVIDVLRLHLDWYNWTLKGGERPDFLKDNVCYYVGGADIWRHVPTLNDATAEMRVLYLAAGSDAISQRSGGVLQEKLPPVGSGQLVYDPNHPRLAERELEWNCPARLRPIFPVDDITDARPVEALRSTILVYETRPYAEPFEIAGRFEATLWIAIDQPDTDFCISIYEVLEDGRSLLLSSDTMRARFREDLRTERLVPNSEPIEYSFDGFTFLARKIAKGSRLRLVVTPNETSYLQRNSNMGGVVSDEILADGTSVNIVIHSGGSCPSALAIPYGQTQS